MFEKCHLLGKLIRDTVLVFYGGLVTEANSAEHILLKGTQMSSILRTI